jgi:spore germination protein GerM
LKYYGQKDHYRPQRRHHRGCRFFLLARPGQMPAGPDEADGQAAAEKLAKEWIENSAPTYVFDGSDLNLASTEELPAPDSYRFVFEFTSSAAGYGDRSDMMLAQVITPHTMEVVVSGGEIQSALTDGVFDETLGKMTNEAPLGRQTVDIFLVRSGESGEEFIPVAREIGTDMEPAWLALQELLAGPRAEETADGLSTAIPETAILQRLDIEDGIAYPDFSQDLQAGVAGSARVMAIRSQIEETLKQFPEVNEVVISIDSQSEDILQP